MNETFELKLMKSFKKHFIVLLIIAVVGGAAAGIFKKLTTTMEYSTTFTIAVEHNIQKTDNGSTVIDMTTPDYKIFTKLGNSTENLQQVFKELNLSEKDLLDVKNSVEVIDNGSVITYKVKDTDEKKVVALANSMAENTVKLAHEIRPDYKVNIIDRPSVAMVENVLSLKKYYIGGFLGTFILALFVVYLFDQFKNNEGQDNRN